MEATALGVIEKARTMLAQASRITVFTGAGISTDSGIPDYRGPNGLWTTNPKAEKLSTLSHYLEDPEVRQLAWQNRMHSPAWGAVPNAGHYSLVKLEERGVLVALVTQNIDELHQAAGHNPQHVVEVHGTMHYSRCWGCGDRRPMPEILVRVRAGEADPSCQLCSGILKSDTISFGQSLVPEVIERAMTASENCDVLLAVGSSLSVYPAANVVPRAKAAGARIIIINGEPTKMDQYADVVIVGNIGDVLPAVIG